MLQWHSFLPPFHKQVVTNRQLLKAQNASQIVVGLAVRGSACVCSGTVEEVGKVTAEHDGGIQDGRDIEVFMVETPTISRVFRLWMGLKAFPSSNASFMHDLVSKFGVLDDKNRNGGNDPYLDAKVNFGNEYEVARALNFFTPNF
ncbi:hypothetical protein SUGI_0947460 [Cryptomeria japonica]|nr:hypothetical protein SUGI_0947460 [Cryptomeria japonica]